MEIKKLSADQDFQSVINNINDYLKKINDYQVNHQSEFGLPIEELGQFRKSWFYNNWQARFRKIQAFNGLGLTGLINIPNTTFEEWLWWFHEWAESFMDDYNKFKELMFQALLVIEKHLEAVDTELQDHENRITDNTSRLDGDDVKLNEHEQRLDGLDRDLAKEVQDRINGDNAEKNARIAKDNDLQNQINAEKGAREQKDNDLQNQFNQEKTDRQNGDQGLQNQVNNLGTKVDNNTRAISNIAKLSVKIGYDHTLDLTDAMIANGWSKTPYYEGTSYGQFHYSFIDTDGDNVADYLMYNIAFNNMKKHITETKPGGFWGAVSDPNYRERYGNVVVKTKDPLLQPIINWIASDTGAFTELNGQRILRVFNWTKPINNQNGAPNGTDGWYLLPSVSPDSDLLFLLTRSGGFPSDFNNNDGIDFVFADMTYSERQYIDIKSLNLSMEGR